MQGGLSYLVKGFIEADEKKLWDVVHNKSLKVPHHQRDYSWEETEVEAFLRDVEKLKIQNFDDISALPHFIGAMVFIQNQDDESYEIIDGQQRLTTTMLYFAMLKLIANKLTNHDHISIVNARFTQYLFSNLPGQTRISRLTLDRAQEFYNMILSKDTISEIAEYYDSLQVKKDVEKNIYNICVLIYNYFDNKLSGLYSNDAKLYASVMQYIEAVQTMMVAIEINVQQAGIAYTVFETLNARGKELSAANLIKNTLLSFSERQHSQDNVLQKWSNIIEEITQFNNAEITDFLTQSYFARYGQLNNNLFDSVKQILENNTITAQEYADSINDDHLSYLKLKLLNSTQDSYFNKNVFDHLNKLNNYIKVTRIYPLLLTGRKYLNNKDFETLVISLVNFAFRYIVVIKKSADSLHNLIINWSTRLRTANITIQTLRNEMQNNATDGDFKLAFETFSPGTQYQRFYVIKTIEDHLAGGQGMTVLDQSPTQHLEHIMPQKPNITDWPHLYVNTTTKELNEKFTSYINRIGNHTVLEKDINGHIKNKNFSYKNTNMTKNDYQHSKLKLPSNIAKYLNNNCWDFKSIDDRGKDLAQYAVSAWAL